MTWIMKDEQDVVGPELRAQWEVVPAVREGMSHTAIRNPERGPLFATGLVVAMYLSAAFLFVQNFF